MEEGNEVKELCVGSPASAPGPATFDPRMGSSASDPPDLCVVRSGSGPAPMEVGAVLGMCATPVDAS